MKTNKFKAPKIIDRLVREPLSNSEVEDSNRGSSKGKASGSSPSGSGVLPPRTINPEQEDEIVKQLEQEQRKKLREDPLKELNEALMDRTQAGKKRKNKICKIRSSDSSGDSEN